MAAYVKISAKAARAMASEGPHPGLDAALVELRRALSKLDRLKVRKAPRLEAKKKARADKNEETASIRQNVFVRSRGICECGCGRVAEEMDHAMSRRVRQTERNCWALSSRCHVEKTNNRPSPTIWLALFSGHCASHGYSRESAWATARIEWLNQRAAFREAQSR